MVLAAVGTKERVWLRSFYYPAVPMGVVPSRSASFVVRSQEPLNGGPSPETLTDSLLTPNDAFFVRNHGPVPKLSREDHRLIVDGLVLEELSLGLAELEAGFERVELASTIACAGQRRAEMSAVEPIVGELPWGPEAVSSALWSGWRLADVLRAAGIRDDGAAAHVGFEGADVTERLGRSFTYGASIPLAKAFSPEVLLVDRMNGQPLPPVHGYPLRVLVPGYIGARQVKWLKRVEVRSHSSENYFQRVAYRMYPREMRAKGFVPLRDGAHGVELTELEVNSVICQPLAGERVPAGSVTVRGAAYTGGDRIIEAVEVSLDGGAAWHEARLIDLASTDSGAAGQSGEGPRPYLWRFFEAQLPPPPGPPRTLEVLARARDSGGHVQPEHPAECWNFKGYMNNAWSRVTFHWG